MTKPYTFPHWNVNVIDNSIYKRQIVEGLPLFRPIYFMKGQKGPVGKPVWVSGDSIIETYGAATFDNTSKYYSREALFIQKAGRTQGAFIVRVASADAKYGTLVLQLKVKKTQVTQYERDEYGQFVFDTDGERIPMTDSSGAIIKEPGYELKWMTRTLKLDQDHPESHNALKPTSGGSGDSAYTIYPILTVKAKDVGEFSNDMGIKLFVDDNLDTTLATAVQSLPYSLGFIKRTYGQSTVSPIKTKTGADYVDFVAKPNQIDARFARPVSYADIVDYNYPELPFETYLYSDNIREIGEKILSVETDDTLTDPYMVNLAEPLNIDGVPYAHVVLAEEDDSIYLGSNRIVYVEGGDDGDISDAAIEALTRQYLDDDIYPALVDQARYPFTHIIDTGVSIQTKRSFINYLGKNDAFKVVLATQDCNTGRYNTQDEDVSMGAALSAAALLHPESVLYGTQCCRCEIYTQAGRLTDSYRHPGIVPSTFDVVAKKAEFMRGTSCGPVPAGLPGSDITCFKDRNWLPYDKNAKQDAWDIGLNSFQSYLGETNIHWPAMRTVYFADTSVLSGAFFTDAIVLIKHKIRWAWANYVGTEYTFGELAQRAKETLSRELRTMLGNTSYAYDIDFYQTEEETKIGYIAHCQISLTGPAQNRIWEADIICNREGYSPDNDKTIKE